MSRKKTPDGPRPDAVKIRNHRLRKGWTQEQFAEQAGYDKKTIENLEAGKRVYPSTLAAAAKALGLSAEDLLLSEDRAISSATAETSRSSFPTIMPPPASETPRCALRLAGRSVIVTNRTGHELLFSLSLDASDIDQEPPSAARDWKLIHTQTELLDASTLEPIRELMNLYKLTKEPGFFASAKSIYLGRNLGPSGLGDANAFRVTLTRFCRTLDEEVACPVLRPSNLFIQLVCLTHCIDAIEAGLASEPGEPSHWQDITASLDLITYMREWTRAGLKIADERLNRLIRFFLNNQRA